MVKVLYITTIGSTMVFFEKFIARLVADGFVVDIATNETGSNVPNSYSELGCKVYPISCTRSPFNVGTLKAIYEIRQIVKNNGYDVVHCHTPIAAMCARLACRPLRKRGVKVMYTAHGFHFYKGAPLKNWLIYFPIEKLCSYFTDVLITINKEDYELAKKRMNARKIEYVPGVGIDTKRFILNKSDKNDKRKEIGVPNDAVLLVSVGELNINKNHSVVIRAVARQNDSRIHYAIAGEGPFKEDLKRIAQEEGVSEQIHILGYRKDVPEIYSAADICVFPSIREGLGLAAVEGMASGLPLIVSENRGTRDYAQDGKNAYVCKYSSVLDFAEAISVLARDTIMREEMGALNVKLAEKYDSQNVLPQMKKIYADLIDD